MDKLTQLFLFFALLGFCVGLVPGFIIGCAYMSRVFRPRR